MIILHHTKVIIIHNACSRTVWLLHTCTCTCTLCMYQHCGPTLIWRNAKTRPSICLYIRLSLDNHAYWKCVCERPVSVCDHECTSYAQYEWGRGRGEGVCWCVSIPTSFCLSTNNYHKIMRVHGLASPLKELPGLDLNAAAVSLHTHSHCSTTILL